MIAVAFAAALSAGQFATGGSCAAMMNARLKFEETPALVQSGRSICFARTLGQRPGAEALVLEPGEFTVFQPANERAAITNAEGSVSGQTLMHMKELGWRFTVAEPGEYSVWLRAKFPLAAGYNHGEIMDDGEYQRIHDSVDDCKADKFAPLPSQMGGKWLEPGLWHWFRNCDYTLAKGEHFFHWPANGAWCGGCLLDRIVLIKKGSVLKPQDIRADATMLPSSEAKSAVAVSRRIKTERIARWSFTARYDAGDGRLDFEYSYGGRDWRAFTPGEVIETPEGAGYLYLRLGFTAPETVGAKPPLVYTYQFKVEKKELGK